jgi:adenylosuccinate lyase
MSGVTLDAPLGPLDGRYRATVAPLADLLSEAALNRQRVHIEVEWLIHLGATGAVPGMRALTETEQARLRDVVRDFDGADVAELAEIEGETQHDVKAVEYFLRRRTEGTTLHDLAELIHLFCTSEDINNLAYALMVRDAVREVWLPAASALTDQLADLARRHAGAPMLARTHGQPAGRACGPSISARSTEQPGPSRRMWRGPRTPTGRPCRAASSRASG